MSAEIFDLSEEFSREQRDASTYFGLSINGFFSPTRLHIHHDNDDLLPLFSSEKEEDYSLPSFGNKIQEFEIIWGILGTRIFSFLFEIILKEAQEKIDTSFAGEIYLDALERITYDLRLEITAHICDILDYSYADLDAYMKAFVLQKYELLGYKERVTTLIDENIFHII